MRAEGGGKIRTEGDTVEVVIPADAESVRHALRTMFDTLLLRGLPEDHRGTAELVLAEALNNIVEHAYGRPAGQICITLNLGPGDLVCRIEDTGKPMPGDALPGGDLRLYDDAGEVAEGGFGWHLIRALSRDLDYRRTGGRNMLSFRLDAGQEAGADTGVDGR